MTQKDEIAALKRELANLKNAMKPVDRAAEAKATAEFQSEMHVLRERNASVIPPWMRDACAGGVTDADARDLARAARAPTGPSSAGIIPSSQTVSNVRGTNVAGSGTGWAREIPLSNPPGTRYVDAIVEADTARQRAEKQRAEKKS
jgi:hypothetical protein